jgi:hypothetical protein
MAPGLCIPSASRHEAIAPERCKAEQPSPFLRSAIIRYFAIKSSVFMSLGASGLNRAVLVFAILFGATICLLSCGGTSKPKDPPSGLTERVLASQDVSAGTSFAGLVIIDGINDSLPRVGSIGAGSLTSPGLMVISSNRATLLAFDSGTNNVQIVSTLKEATSGSISLPGSTTSMVIPAQSATIGFAAVPTTTSLNGVLPNSGAVVEMSLATNSTVATIGVPSVQTVVSNSGGTQLLAFSNDRDSMAVISPANAVGPVDTGCDSGSVSTACLLVGGFSRPVYAIFSNDGSTAYVLNCGAECGGSQPASVAVVNTASLAITNTIPVEGATWAYLAGSTLYVAGTPPGTNTCAGGPTTAAPTCGRLDIVDLGSLSVVNTSPLYIPDGYHDRMDLGSNGQLFIGSHTCTTVGDVNNPVGEVRGCLAVYDTNDGAVIIPPDNGDVTGLQSFSSRYVEYVAEGGNLRVYNTISDTLLINTDFLPAGTVPIVGVVIDVKAIDSF